MWAIAAVGALAVFMPSGNQYNPVNLLLRRRLTTNHRSFARPRSFLAVEIWASAAVQFPTASESFVSIHYPMDLYPANITYCP